MKLFYKLLPLIFLFPLFTLAQSNYKPGIIVNLKGDTVNGFVDFQEWANNPESVNFKDAPGGPVRRFMASEIIYFQVGHVVAYQSYNGPVSMDATNINHLSTGRDTSFKTMAVFLKLEQDGKYIALYSYADDLKKRYFVSEKKDNKAFELIYRTYVNSDLSYNTVNEERYKGRLIYLSSKYNSYSDNLKKNIEDAAYDQDLVTIVNKINRTTNPVQFHGKSPVSFYAGISAGLTSMKPPANDGVFTYRNVSPVNSYLPRIAAGINIYTNPEVGKVVFKGEIAVSANSFKTYFNGYYNLSSSARSYLTLNQLTVSFDPQVQYNIYNTDHLKFYLDAGISINFSKYSNNSLYDGLYDFTTSNYIPAITNWFSYPFSAGVVLNGKIAIFVTYTLPADFTTINYTYSSTQIGINYTFGSNK